MRSLTLFKKCWARTCLINNADQQRNRHGSRDLPKFRWVASPSCRLVGSLRWIAASQCERYRPGRHRLDRGDSCCHCSRNEFEQNRHLAVDPNRRERPRIQRGIHDRPRCCRDRSPTSGRARNVLATSAVSVAHRARRRDNGRSGCHCWRSKRLAWVPVHVQQALLPAAIFR